MMLPRYDSCTLYVLTCLFLHVSEYLLFQDSARVSGLLSISRTLRAKADTGDASKSELGKFQAAHKALKEAI